MAYLIWRVLRFHSRPLMLIFNPLTQIAFILSIHIRMQPFSVGSAMPMDSANALLHLLYSTIWVGSQFVFSHYEKNRYRNIAPGTASKA